MGGGGLLVDLVCWLRPRGCPEDLTLGRNGTSFGGDISNITHGKRRPYCQLAPHVRLYVSEILFQFGNEHVRVGSIAYREDNVTIEIYKSFRLSLRQSDHSFRCQPGETFKYHEGESVLSSGSKQVIGIPLHRFQGR